MTNLFYFLNTVTQCDKHSFNIVIFFLAENLFSEKIRKFGYVSKTNFNVQKKWFRAHCDKKNYQLRRKTVPWLISDYKGKKTELSIEHNLLLPQKANSGITLCWFHKKFSRSELSDEAKDECDRE